MFSAIVISEASDGTDGSKGIDVAVRDVDEADLPEGDVTVDVEYSTVNYKDALAIVNGKPVVRSFPDGAGHRLRRHGRREQPRRLVGGRHRHP